MTLPLHWWRNEAVLRAELQRHGSINAAAKATGATRSVLQDWAGRFQLLIDDLPSEEGGPEWLLVALKKLGDNATVYDIADYINVSPKDVRTAAKQLAERGFRIDLDDHHIELLRIPPAQASETFPALFEGDEITFGVVSDTHLGDKEQRLSELHTAYEVMAREGIEHVYHPGDLVCGKGIYSMQIRDSFLHTFDEQVEYAIENYPHVEGITTHIIGGNHDLEGDFGRQGADPVRAVSFARPDILYYGEYSAWFELANGAYMHMLHPGGGSSYAISYRAQKLVEGYESGRKPSMLLLGHFHRQGSFNVRNIQVILCGAFEGSTNLAKRYGMGPPAVGFHIIKARLAEDGSMVRIRPEWMPFYNGRVVM